MGTPRRGSMIGGFAALLLLALLLVGVFGFKTYDESRSRVVPGRVLAADYARHRVTVAYPGPDGREVTRTVSGGTAKRGSHPAGEAIGLRYWPGTERYALDEGIPPLAGLLLGGVLLPVAATGFVVGLRRERRPSSS